jgi:hypothetical protein
MFLRSTSKLWRSRIGRAWDTHKRIAKARSCEAPFSRRMVTTVGHVKEGAHKRKKTK